MNIWGCEIWKRICFWDVKFRKTNFWGVKFGRLEKHVLG